MENNRMEKVPNPMNFAGQEMPCATDNGARYPMMGDNPYANNNGMAGDIDRFISALPSVQYMPTELAKLGMLNFPSFIRSVWKNFTENKTNTQPLMHAGMALCNIAATIAKRTGNENFAVLPEILQNCIALNSIGNTINSKIRYVWGKKELMYFVINPLFPNLFDCTFADVRGPRGKYGTVMSMSTIELSALAKFCNGKEETVFFSSQDKASHKVVPLCTTIESVINKTSTPGAPAVLEFKPEFSAENKAMAVYAFRIDKTMVVLRGFVNFNGRPMASGRMTAECLDTFECLMVHPADAIPTKENPGITVDIISEFINSLFVKFMDTKKFIYTIIPGVNTLQAIQRPTILPTHYISKQIENTVAGMENLFARNMARCYAFVGNPGTGKTIITKQISNHFDQYCTLNIDSATLTDNAVMDSIIGYVKAIKKCIIIIDDLDGVLSNKEGGRKDIHVNAYIRLFDELNSAVKNDGVSFIFLTTINDPSAINSTVMKRSGRIDETIEIGYPEPDVIDYLIEYNDTQINGKRTTDFKTPEFADALKATYEANLSAADLKNIFSDMTIQPEFNGVYTPEMLKSAVAKVMLRNETSKKTFLD